MRTVALALLMGLSGGCTGTETGNPSFAGAVGVNTHSSDPTRVALRTSNGGIRVDEAWISIGQIGVIAEGDCPDLSQATASTQFGADDHARPEGAFTSLEIQPGLYCAATISLTPTSGMIPDGSPPQLAGNSFVLRGSLADDTPWRLVADVSASVLIMAADDPFELSEDVPSVLVAFDVARWLEEVDIERAVPESDGSIQIDRTHNTSLLETFESNVPEGVELYRDEDGDGTVDAEPELLGRGMP